MDNNLFGKCLECSDKGFATLLFEGIKPIIGHIYKVIDITHGTLAQNNTFHDLIHIFYDYMLKNDNYVVESGGITFDLRCDTPEKLKGIIKQRYGKGFLKFYYADILDGKPVIMEADTYDLIPDYAKVDFANGNRRRIIGKLLSWSKYTLSNRKTTISRLMYIMDIFGVDSPKYLELRSYFDDKELKYINRVSNKFNGKIIGE